MDNEGGKITKPAGRCRGRNVKGKNRDLDFAKKKLYLCLDVGGNSANWLLPPFFAGFVGAKLHRSWKKISPR